MEAVKDKDNVFALHQPTGIFSPSLKRKLEEGIKPLTDKSTEVVEKIEMVACSVLVGAFISFAKSIGTSVGTSIGKKIAGYR